MSTDKGKNNALVNNNSDVEEGEIPDQESLSSAANSKRGKENPKNKVLRSRSASRSSSRSRDSDESKKGWWKKKKLKREGGSASSHDFNSDDSDDEEIIEQTITDSNYHKKGWNNKKDYRLVFFSISFLKLSKETKNTSINTIKINKLIIGQIN